MSKIALWKWATSLIVLINFVAGMIGVYTGHVFFPIVSFSIATVMMLDIIYGD